MRSLDKEADTVLKDLDDCEKKIIGDLKKRGRQGGSSAPDAAALDARGALAKKARQMVDEKVQIAEQALGDCDVHLERLDDELHKFEHHLRTSGEFNATGYAAPGEQVAAMPEQEWILARVKEYDITTGVYTVADEDDTSKTYEVPEAQTTLLEAERVGKGEEVFAVYPDTTSFYPAVVTSVPRRAGAVGGALGGQMTCTVQFVDDNDETGRCPDRPVPLRYIFKRVEAESPDE